MDSADIGSNVVEKCDVTLSSAVQLRFACLIFPGILGIRGVSRAIRVMTSLKTSA